MLHDEIAFVFFFLLCLIYRLKTAGQHAVKLKNECRWNLMYTENWEIRSIFNAPEKGNDEEPKRTL
jgi:hypothetical protein